MDAPNQQKIILNWKNSPSVIILNDYQSQNRNKNSTKNDKTTIATQMPLINFAIQIIAAIVNEVELTIKDIIAPQREKTVIIVEF